MERSIQISLIMFVVLGLGLVYVNDQANTAQAKVEEVSEMNSTLQTQIANLENMIVEAGVTIDNGTVATTEAVRLIKGASALDALERVARVGTTVSAKGVFINSINGTSNDTSSQTYWMIYKLENKSDWKLLSVGVDSYEVEEGDNIKFSYEKASW